MDEARMQVKGVVQGWLLETVGKKPQGEGRTDP